MTSCTCMGLHSRAWISFYLHAFGKVFLFLIMFNVVLFHIRKRHMAMFFSTNMLNGTLLLTNSVPSSHG